MRSGDAQNSRKNGCSERTSGATGGAESCSARDSALLTSSTRWPAKKMSGLRMAHCSSTSMRSTSLTSPRVLAMLVRISSAVCRVLRVGACMKWTISLGDRSRASEHPLSRAWATPSSVRGTSPLWEATLPWRIQWTLIVDTGFSPREGRTRGPGRSRCLRTCRRGRRTGLAAAILQGSRVPLERDTRSQDRAVHHELFRRPARLSRRRLLEEVATDGLRVCLDDPPGGLLGQAGRLLKVRMGPDVPLRPVGPEEQDVSWLDGLAGGLQSMICLV